MVNRIKGSSNYLDNGERGSLKKNRIIYPRNEAKFDEGLKEIGNFEKLYVALTEVYVDLTELDDGRKGWSKEGDKGAVSSSDTCFSVYHL